MPQVGAGEGQRLAESVNSFYTEGFHVRNDFCFHRSAGVLVRRGGYMRRFSVVSFLAALLTAIFLVLLAGCGGGSSSANTTVTTIMLFPTTISLNEGAVGTLSASAQNSAGST